MGSKKGFPSFGISQSGAFIADLKNYNLPDFILTLIAKECDSDLLERGRIDDRLTSMNDASLELLHRVFVDCDDDEDGKFGQLRFFSYVSSMYHKSEILINDMIPGKSGKNHKVPIAVKMNGMYVAIGFNKAKGGSVTKKDVNKFYLIAIDVKNGEHGTQLIDAIYGSSVGFKGEAIVELEKLSKTGQKDPENKLNFKTANFENRIYSVTKCWLESNFFFLTYLGYGLYLKRPPASIILPIRSGNGFMAYVWFFVRFFISFLLVSISSSSFSEILAYVFSSISIGSK